MALPDIISWHSLLLQPGSKESPKKDTLHLDIDASNVVDIACTIGGLAQRTGGELRVTKLVLRFDEGLPHPAATSMMRLLMRELKPEDILLYGWNEDTPLPPPPPGQPTPNVKKLEHTPCDRSTILATAADPTVPGLLIVVASNDTDMPYDHTDKDYTAYLYMDGRRLPKNVWKKVFDSYEPIGYSYTEYAPSSESDSETLSESESDSEEEDGDPQIIDLVGGYSKWVDGRLGSNGTWPCLIDTFEPIGRYVDRGYQLHEAIEREFFENEHTDDIVLVASAKVVPRGSSPTEGGADILPDSLIYVRNDQVKKAIWDKKKE